MFRLAHISDPHLGPLPPIDRKALILKQRLGLLNWERNRATSVDERVLESVLADMEAASPDHIAITGDLINLGLPKEIENAARWLERFGDAEKASLVPGNHDAYIRQAEATIGDAWGWLMGGGERSSRANFPYVKHFGNVALIGVSTAIATAPLMATGRLGRDQIAKLGEMLDEEGREGRFRVLMIHHPPDTGATVWHKRLIDAAALREKLQRTGAELVLHGHNHRNRIAAIGEIPVVGVSATAMLPHGERPGGSWNMLEIEATSRKLTLTTRTWTPDGMADLQKREWTL